MKVGRVVVRTLASVALVGMLTAARPAGGATPDWRQLYPTVSPQARLAPAMAFDPVSNRVVLFGGFGGTTYLNDTWVWDGTSWTRVAPPTSPPARDAAGMAWDARQRALVLYGGFDGTGYLGDTWLWNGATTTWTQAPRPAVSPPTVTGPALFTDPLTGHADLFGGYDGHFYQLQTWQWSGSRWVQLHPATTPSARAAMVATLDPSRHQVVLWGGLADVNPVNTWLWDGTDWTQALPAHTPDGLYDTQSAYDPRVKQVVMFGGGNGGVDSGHTFRWNGTDWVQVRTQDHPIARESAGMAFDRAGRRLLVFGGQNRATIFGDTWGL